MKKVSEKFLSLFMVFAMLLTSFSAFIPMTVHAASPEYINRLDLNLIINTPLTDAMTGDDVNYYNHVALSTTATSYRVYGSSYIYQCPSSTKCNISDATVVTATNLVAGNYTYFQKSIGAYPFETNVLNPDYDFDQSNLGNVEVWINGAKNTDVVVGNYNTAWRSVSVYIPVTVTQSSATQHTVTFDLDGGTIEGNDTYSANVVNGGNVVKPQDPVKSGYRFDNWCIDSTLTTPFDFANTTITAPTTIFAKYIRIHSLYVYIQTAQEGWGTVYLDGNPSTQGFFADEGSTHTATAVAASGYKFKEWQKDGAVVSTNANYTINNLSETTNLYGIFEVDTSTQTQHTVTFINGINNSTISTTQVNDGGNAIRPATDPTMANHTFDNWYADASMTTLFDFTTQITKPTPIYAKFNPNNVWINLDANGGTGSGSIPATYGSNWVVEHPSDRGITEPSNKEFNGWKIGDTIYNVGDTYYNITSDITAIAQWKPIQYSVTFYDGSNVLDTVQVNAGEKVTRPTTDPSKSGYTFDNWYVDSTCTTPFDFDNTSITANTPIYAKFTENAIIPTTYTITVTDGTSDRASAEKNETITITANVPVTGKEFDKWVVEAGTITLANENNSTTTFTMPEENVKVKATYKDVIPTQYTVTFINGNNSTTIGTTTVSDGAKVTRPTTDPSMANHTFDNWYADASMTILFDFANTTITGHTPIYAKFIPNATNYTITYDLNGGTAGSIYVSSQSYSSGTTITNIDPVDHDFAIPPFNKVFDAYEIDGARYEIESTYTVSKDVTVKLLWKDKYTIESGDESFTLGGTNDIVIKASGDLAKLTEIKVDGTTLASSNYTTVSGSTVLTLLNSYLNTLSVGDHTVTFIYDDGSVDATLKVLAAQNTSGDDTNTTGDNTNTNTNTGTETNNNNTTNDSSTGSPQTGDNIVNYIITLIISIIGLAGGSLYLNKKKIFANK